MAKKPGAGGIMVVAVILGLITAYLIWSYLRKAEEKNRKNWQPVVVALVDIKPRTKITRDMIKLEQYPKDIIAENSFNKPEDVEGHLTQKEINAKAQIRNTDLVGKDQSPTLAFKVPEGMRAIAVACDEVKAVGTSIQPGDKIDILARYQDSRTRRELTKIILQNVQVLAVNRGVTDAGGKEGASSSMTLAVRPEQTELIAAADGAGALRFVLRGVNAKDTISSTGVNAGDLDISKEFEEPTPPPTAPASTEGAMTRVIIPVPSQQRRPEMIIIRGFEERTVTP
jgi:pilus assembly protein CpaB